MRSSWRLMGQVRRPGSGRRGGREGASGVVHTDHVAFEAAGGRGGQGLPSHGGVGGTGGDVGKGIVHTDHVAFEAVGGRGGQGLSSHGAVGGTGGDVVLVAKERVTLGSVLKRLPPNRRLIGRPGGDARKVMIYAPSGRPTKLHVPKGVVLTDKDGKQLGELNDAGEEFVVARGATGAGPGNNYKAQRSPFKAFNLDIKLLADMGLVGYPNAGKSTLLSGLSRTAPAISAFPFTTLKPQIGTIVYPDGRRMSVADLPGLIEGAHANVGQGHRFLKHVERTRLLLLVVDLTGFQLNQTSPFRSAFQTIQLLNRELELYQEALLDKPAALVLNKTDLPGASERLAELSEALEADGGLSAASDLAEELRPTIPLRFRRTFAISALHKEGLEELKDGLRSLVDEVDDEHRQRRRHVQLDEEQGAARLA